MKLKKLAAFAASLAMAASVASASAVSASAYTSSINGGEYSFEKYLAMENEATVPNVEFGFTVAPIESSEAIAATSTTLEVMPGPAGIKFKKGVTDVTVDTTDSKKATAAFKNSDSTTIEASAASKSVDFKSPKNDDEKFATKALTLDLTEVTFSEPGVYRYKITEIATTGVAGITNDSDSVRYLDVYVKNATNSEEVETGELAIMGYFIHTGAAAPKTGAADNSVKSSGFSNYYKTNDLKFSKAVTGNQGSKDKFFKFTVKLTNSDGVTVNDSDSFQIGGSWTKTPTQNSATKYTAAEMDTNDVSSLTYAQLSAADGYTFYLQNGQNIEIQGIPDGLGYVITEVQEDYTPSVAMAASGDTKTGDTATADGTADIAGVKNDTTFTITDTYLKTDARANFTNDRDGNIPTGLISTVAGSAIIILLGAAGVTGGVIYLRKKKAEDE